MVATPCGKESIRTPCLRLARRSDEQIAQHEDQTSSLTHHGRRSLIVRHDWRNSAAVAADEQLVFGRRAAVKVDANAHGLCVLDIQHVVIPGAEYNIRVTC